MSSTTNNSLVRACPSSLPPLPHPISLGLRLLSSFRPWAVWSCWAMRSDVTHKLNTYTAGPPPLPPPLYCQKKWVWKLTPYALGVTWTTSPLLSSTFGIS